MKNVRLFVLCEIIWFYFMLKKHALNDMMQKQNKKSICIKIQRTKVRMMEKNILLCDMQKKKSCDMQKKKRKKTFLGLTRS